MFTPLIPEDVTAIHRCSLRLLENTGVEVHCQEAARLFRQAGADVSGVNERAVVRLPPALVEECLRRSPKSFVVKGRGSKQAVFARGRPPLFGNSGVPHLIADPVSGERREVTLADFIDLVKLLDGLEHVDFISTPCTFTDIADEVHNLVTFFYFANTTGKPFGVDFNSAAGFQRVLELAGFLKERVYGGEDFVAFGFCPVISPLRLDDMGTGQMIAAAAAGIALFPVTMAQIGVSAPVTLAGTLVVMNAEILAMLTLVQIARAGTGFFYGTIPGATNFSSGEMLTAVPELPLLNSAATQMAAFYDLPNWATAGRTESNILDIQAGYETAFGVPWVAMSGATYISAVGGFLQSVTAEALAKYVIDNEIVGMTKRVLAAITVDEDTCALDLIDAVGPGGHYLGEEHTVSHLRREHFRATITEQSYWETWHARGRPTALQRAQKRAADIIASHGTPPLPADVLAEIKLSFPELAESAAWPGP